MDVFYLTSTNGGASWSGAHNITANGINAFGKKNFVGTFSPPFAVINDARFLETLDR